jgi:hypothetical protein
MVLGALSSRGCSVSARVVLIVQTMDSLYHGKLNLVSGVIHRSGTGSTMFLIFTDKLIIILETFGMKLTLVADGVKINAEVGETKDATNLQSTLDSSSSWINTWQLSVSISKSCLLLLGRPRID